jgi:HAD superfamily hydrolase (TIGR01549 family)
MLLDMDGTLTTPMLDFPAMKMEMGIGTRPILEALAEMDALARQRAEAILLRHEERAACESTLNPGCRELLAWNHDRHLPIALITRNSRQSVRTVLQRHGLAIDVLVSREDGRFKPDPAALHIACAKLGVRAADAWMIGDGRYDVEAGNAAEARTIWLSHGRQRDFDAEPWRTVYDLPELLELLASCTEAGDES